MERRSASFWRLMGPFAAREPALGGSGGVLRKKTGNCEGKGAEAVESERLEDEEETCKM